MSPPPQLLILDHSAILMTRDHLMSSSISATVNLCGDYKDASGKMIKRYLEKEERSPVNGYSF